MQCNDPWSEVEFWLDARDSIGLQIAVRSVYLRAIVCRIRLPNALVLAGYPVRRDAFVAIGVCGCSLVAACARPG
jgi:hypothetical protein